MEPNILIKEVNFTYNKGKDNEFQALINVSLQIYPEEFVIIFGPSGCGKSMF
jgi:ABC-type lipoprotein export system ATPase subunit